MSYHRSGVFHFFVVNAILVNMFANCSVVRSYRTQMELSKFVQVANPGQHGRFVTRVSYWDCDLIFGHTNDCFVLLTSVKLGWA